MYETITVKKHNLILTNIHYIGILCSFKEIRCVVLYCAFDFFYLLKEKHCRSPPLFNLHANKQIERR